MNRFAPLSAALCAGLTFATVDASPPAGGVPDALTRSVQDAACDLYRATDEGGNHLLSPYSIVTAFGQLQAGARGETAAQLAEAFRWQGLEGDALHRVIRASMQALEPERARDGTPLTLRVVNRAFGQEGYGFVPGYLDLLRRAYGAPLEPMNFVEDPDGSREAINGWVEEQTEDKIQDLLPPPAVSEATRLVLVNAIYFHGSWADPFDARSTQDRPFTLASGEAVQVPTMRQVGMLGYGAGDGWQAARLHYQGYGASMVVILPDDLEAFEQGLTGDRLREVLGGVGGGYSLTLTMPRFEFEGSYDLIPALQGLGVRDAFQFGAADFTGIEPERELFVSAAVHKTFIAVDEEGTEAAAATAISMAAGGVPQAATLTLDRPFLILIESDGLPLFLGRVADPR